jgi:hypothetical protein
VSGAAGSPITYIGDYTGANTDGVGGVVRITGSDDDITATRWSCVYGPGKHYRTFENFQMDFTPGNIIYVDGGAHHWILENCYISETPTLVSCTDWQISRCFFDGKKFIVT